LDTVSLALIASALVIIIGFLGNYLFERTGVPDMLFLILSGMIFGPILGVFDPEIVIELSPYIAALALVFILFDGGIKLNVYQVLSHSPRAALLAVLSFLFSLSIIAGFMIGLLGVPPFYGLLFGSIFGGSSSICVISLASKIKVSEKCSTTLILESAISDILCIVVSLTIIGVILTGQADFTSVILNIASTFLIGAVVGGMFGLIWLVLLKRAIDMPFCYMLTLAVILVAYVVSEQFGGSGALSSLVFGLTLGNEKEIFKKFKRDRLNGVAVDEGLKRFESEIAFLIRIFFFVFLGLIATIYDIGFVFLGVVLSILLLIVRFGSVRLAVVRSTLDCEWLIMTAVMTRGLAEAVLATLPIEYGLLYADVFINLAVVIIIATAIITTVGVVILSRR
jgi:cell volume regulation protein A